MTFSLAKALFRWSWKEVRQGDLWPVLFAMILVIASVFALSSLAYRMEQVVVKQGKDALMADTVFVSDHPISPSIMAMIDETSLTTTIMTRFTSMMFVGDEMKLVTVKAVEASFPLRGQLSLNQNGVVSSAVAQHQVWLDPELAASMKAKVGDEVSVGDLVSTVSGTITEEPGLSFNPFRQRPTVLIHVSDIGRTGATQLGSRVQYQLFINGDESQIASLKSAVELAPGDEWRDTDRQSRTTDMFNKTQQYLSLVVVIVVLMASATQFLTCHHYAQSRQKTIAMLKSLGASKRWLAAWLLIQVLSLLICALVVGVLLGLGFEYLLRIPMADLLPNPLPSLGIRPFAIAIVTSIAVSIPALGIPILRLLNLPAMAVVQSTQAVRFDLKWWALVLPTFIVAGVAYGDNPMVWLIIIAIVILIALLGVISLGVFKLASRITLTAPLKLALSRINRTPISTGLQLGALTMSLLLLTTLWLVKTDLLSDWNRVIPEDAPNVFAFNISAQEKADYESRLSGLAPSALFPIARGRVTQINGQDAKQYAGGEQASDALRREVNFTWDDALPEYNDVVEGQWSGNNGVSVESEVASELGLKLGDALTFAVNGQEVSAVVNSIRQVEWREMKPNFYFIFTPDVMADFPATWLVSYRVNDQQQAQFNQLSKQFPTISVIDMRTMLDKIQELLRQIVWAVSILALFGVAAGVLLIATLLKLSLDQRTQEMMLYRILGSSRKMLRMTLWAEFGVMALVAGLIASLSSDLLSSLIMQSAFDIDPQWHVALWVLTPVFTFILLILVVKKNISMMISSGYQPPSL
jgi:putative ABC transport system permease protein